MLKNKLLLISQYFSFILSNGNNTFYEINTSQCTNSDYNLKTISLFTNDQNSSSSRNSQNKVSSTKKRASSSLSMPYQIKRQAIEHTNFFLYFNPKILKETYGEEFVSFACLFKFVLQTEGNIFIGNIMQLMFRVIENQTNQNDAVLKLLKTHKLDSYNDSFHSFLKFLSESPLFIYFNLENTIAKDSKVLILEKYFDEFYLFQYQLTSYFSKLFNLKTLTVGDDFDLIVTELIEYIINLIQKNNSFFILPELIHHKRYIIELILENPILLIQLSFLTYKIMVLYLNPDDFFTKIMILSKDNPGFLKIIEGRILEIRLLFFSLIDKPSTDNNANRKIYKILNFLLFLKVKYYDVFVDLCNRIKIVPYNSRFVLKTLNDSVYYNVYKFDVDYLKKLFKNFK